MCASAGKRRPFYRPAVEEMVVVPQVANLVQQQQQQHKPARKIFEKTDRTITTVVS